MTLVTRVKAREGREAVFPTLHCPQLLREAGPGHAGSVRGKEPSSLGRRLQGCSFPPCLCVQGCSSLVPEIHLQGFFSLRAQRMVGKPVLLLLSLCWGGNCILHIVLFKKLFACRCESLGCAEPEGRTHGTGATRCTQLPSPLTAAQASTHLMSYANPWLPESWDFLLFSFTLIFKCLALEDVKKS